MPVPELTIAQLLGWILAALFLQASVAIGVAIWRRPRVAAEALPAALPPAGSASQAAWAGTREFRVVSRAYEDAARSQCSFHLQPADGRPLPDFLPGQFLSFVLQPIDEARQGERRSVTRCYSLSDAPASDHYRVTIKRVPAGLVSKHFHDHVQPGDVLEVRAPSGHFHIDDDVAVPAVLVAGGIGITPMMSMLRWCLQHQGGRVLHLVYGVRHGAEQAFRPELQALAAAHPQLHLHVVYSRPGPDDVPGRDFHHTGHVDVALLRRVLPHGRHRFFVCGPPAMMQTLVPALAEWGVLDEDLHFEAFGPASVQRPGQPVVAEPDAAAAPTEVRFARSGRTLAWDGRESNLLDFAERHGIVVASGCRSGVCGSCETRCLSGGVGYATPPGHDPSPGCGLLCVGRPRSGQASLVLDA